MISNSKEDFHPSAKTIGLFRHDDSVNFLSISNPKQKFWFGLFIWAAFYFGYFAFCLNWLIFDKLGGSAVGSAVGSGWKAFFYGRGLTDSEVASDAVNYGITFARGLVTIMVAWIMVKLSHKNAALIAFLLNTAAFPLLIMPHYALLVLGRMFMAAGGTMLIILIQPVISRFFTPKQKGVLSSITPTAYLFAGLSVCLLFLYKGTGEAVINLLTNHWRMISVICASLTYIPLLAYLVFGRNFTNADNLEEEIDQLEKPENTYLGIIKEKGCWFWIFFYSFLLVGSLLVSFKAPKMISIINKQATDTVTWANLDWHSLYTSLFYLGCLCGMCWGKWAKTKYQRKPIISLCCSVGFLCWLAILGGSFISNFQIAHTLILMSVFFFSFFAMGIQSMILYVPHEYRDNNNSKRLTIFYSYLWGVGYVIYTVYQIIISSCLSSVKDNAQDNAIGAYIGMGLITLFLFLFAVFAFTIKEPRPEYDFFPGLVKFSDLWNRNQRLLNKHKSSKFVE